MQTQLHDKKVMVWCEFTTSTFIRPFFFEEMHDFDFETLSVAGMLQNRIKHSLADKHLLESTTFMQYNTPAHIAR